MIMHRFLKKLFKFFAWTFSIFGTISFLLAILVLFDEEEGKTNTDAFFGFMMFAFVLLGPGLVMLWKNKKAEKKDKLDSILMGFLRTYDRFNISEIAKKMNKSEANAEKIIFDFITRKKEIDLVYHRPSRQYMHRHIVKENHKVFTKCGNCGANLYNLIFFEGENPSCPYCGGGIE